MQMNGKTTELLYRYSIYFTAEEPRPIPGDLSSIMLSGTLYMFAQPCFKRFSDMGLSFPGDFLITVWCEIYRFQEFTFPVILFLL
jgi:hypothetical protein